MISLITSFSRITILIYIIIFTLADIVQLFELKLNDLVANIVNTIQGMMIFLFLINSSAVLYLQKEEPKIILMATFQIMFIILLSIVLNNITVPVSKALINNMLMFMCFSFVFLERLNLDKSLKQLIFCVVALVAGTGFIFLLQRIPNIAQYVFVFAAIGIVALLLVCVVGKVEYGAKLSLSIGGIRVQPSEFVKISYVMFIAGCIVTYKDYRGYLYSTIGAGIHAMILVLSRDLGTALILLVTYMFLTFIAYKNYILLSIELGGAVMAGFIAYNAFPHIQTRFIAWSDPLSVVNDQGYQIAQSLFAIGTGGWFGTGLCKGLPNKIPVVTTDFIFAAISEEMGAVIAVCLIIMYMCTAVIMFNCAYKCTNSFYMLVISGLAIIFAIQTILNIGGVIKFIPSTGVTLPLISNGGSSLLSMFMIIFTIECSEDLWLQPDRGHSRYE